jgi:hypothetical protein
MKKGIRKILVMTVFLAGIMILCGCVSKAQKAQGLFEKEAADYLKAKYGMDITGTLYYTQSKYDSVKGTIDGGHQNTTPEFGVFLIPTGEEVTVVKVDGTFSDNYEEAELLNAWFDTISKELGTTVDYARMECNDSNNMQPIANIFIHKTFGTFLERTTVRYNASNVDTFVDDYYDYMGRQELTLAIYENTKPDDARMEELLKKTEEYRVSHALKVVFVYVYTGDGSSTTIFTRKAADFPEHTIGDGDPYNYFYDGDLYNGYDYHITCSENNVMWE